MPILIDIGILKGGLCLLAGDTIRQTQRHETFVQ
jgi:hypothetical protein